MGVSSIIFALITERFTVCAIELKKTMDRKGLRASVRKGESLIEVEKKYG